MSSKAVLILLSLLATLAVGQELGQYNIDPKRVSVSGLSSGAYFAVQFQVAWSKELMGAGIIAGGPYYCAQGQMALALTTCMNFPTFLPTGELVGVAKRNAQKGLIDDLSSIDSHKIWLFSGTKDSVVKTPAMKALQQFYTQVAPKATVETVFSVPAEHSFPTLNFGGACDKLGSPFVNNCNFDAAGKLLNHIYGNLSAPVDTVSSNILSFDQSKFLAAHHGFGSTGYVYVPTACQKGAVCSLHISFHGCQQSVDNVKDAYYAHAGLNSWAESNNIIVLYPQTTSIMLKNPQACYDWWGFTGADYAVKSGVQMSAVYAMMKRLMSSKTYI